MEKIVVNPSTNIYTALRGAGYNSTYAAIMECIDNSMEDDVNASLISVTVEHNKEENKITKIYIADNGNSMDEDAANRFFALGDSKKSSSSFGKYGMGGKTGCLSIGTKLTVYTKTKNNCVEKRVLDLKNLDGKFEIKMYSENTPNDITKEEIAMFYDKIHYDSHGTLIVIDDIDKIDTNQLSYVNVKNKNYRPLGSFDQKLIKEIALAHTKTIEKNNKEIFVCDQKVNPINYFGGKIKGKDFSGDLIGAVETDIDGCHIRSEVYDCKVNESIIVDDYDIPANALNCGAYVFRNGRLVGKGLGFDFVKSINKGDGHSTNVRYSVEVSGDADKLVNSSFIKAINSGDAFDERLKQFLQNSVEELIKVAKLKRKERADLNKDKELEEEGKKITKSIKRKLKENPIKIQTRVAKNKKKENTTPNYNNGEKNKTPYNTRQNVEHNRIDNSNWLHGITLSNRFLKDDDIFYFSINPSNGKYELSLNVNHPFYELFISKLDGNMMDNFLLFEMVQRLSITNNDKITSDEKTLLLEVQARIDDYRLELQNRVFNHHKPLNKDIVETIAKSKNCVGVGVSSEELGIKTISEKEMEFATAAS